MTQGNELDRIRVTTPCPKRWEELVGDERRRFCGECRLHVHDLSAMRRDEARDFLAASQGRVCVTYARDAEGRVVTVEDGPGRLRSLVSTAASLLVGFLVLVGCRDDARKRTTVDGHGGEGATTATGGDPSSCEVPENGLRVLGGLQYVMGEATIEDGQAVQAPAAVPPAE